MYILMNINECDTFHVSLYLFRSIWHYFVVKNNIHLPVISIVDEIHEYSEVSEMIANAFRMVIGYHLCLTSFTWPAPKALKKNLIRRKESKQLIRLEPLPPSTWKDFNSLHQMLKSISETFTFRSNSFSPDEKLEEFTPLIKFMSQWCLLFFRESPEYTYSFFTIHLKEKKSRLGDALLVADS